MNSTKRHIIIVAGGTGSRINKDVPKQMLLLHNKPVIIHTLNRFVEFDPAINIIVVLHKSLIENFNSILSQYGFKNKITSVEGGETRFHSVLNGLNAITGEGLVGIHDAARPLVSIETIMRAYKTAGEKGNAIPVVSLAESIRYVDKKENKSVNRSNYKIIQTPQCFNISLIKKAFEQGYKPEFTDDATVLESIGEKINLVEGNSENIKLTLPVDFKIAEALMKN